MPKKAPWHSIKQSVHHDNTNCNTGNNIELGLEASFFALIARYLDQAAGQIHA